MDRCVFSLACEPQRDFSVWSSANSNIYTEHRGEKGEKKATTICETEIGYIPRNPFNRLSENKDTKMDQVQDPIYNKGDWKKQADDVVA